MEQSIDPPKLCRDCSNLLGRRDFIDQAYSWRCVEGRNVESSKINLVTGIKETTYVIESLDVLRENSQYCGPKGDWFIPYTKPSYDLMANADASSTAAPRKPLVTNPLVKKVGKDLIDLGNL